MCILFVNKNCQKKSQYKKGLGILFGVIPVKVLGIRFSFALQTKQLGKSTISSVGWIPCLKSLGEFVRDGFSLDEFSLV
jgi:hypothetical protein